MLTEPDDITQNADRPRPPLISRISSLFWKPRVDPPIVNPPHLAPLAADAAVLHITQSHQEFLAFYQEEASSPPIQQAASRRATFAPLSGLNEDILRLWTRLMQVMENKNMMSFEDLQAEGIRLTKLNDRLYNQSLRYEAFVRDPERSHGCFHAFRRRRSSQFLQLNSKSVMHLAALTTAIRYFNESILPGRREELEFAQTKDKKYNRRHFTSI